MQARREEIKLHLFSGHMLSYIETFQGVYKEKKNQNNRMMRSASRQGKVQKQKSLSLYIVAVDTQKPRLKIKNLGRWLIC